MAYLRLVRPHGGLIRGRRLDMAALQAHHRAGYTASRMPATHHALSGTISTAQKKRARPDVLTWTAVEFVLVS
jgi:hypothetical protein